MTDLTVDQLDFLKECEEEFKGRFTEDDTEFMKVNSAAPKCPPIIDPYYGGAAKQRSHNRHERPRHGSGYGQGHSHNQSYGRYRGSGPIRNRDYRDSAKRSNYSSSGKKKHRKKKEERERNHYNNGERGRNSYDHQRHSNGFHDENRIRDDMYNCRKRRHKYDCKYQGRWQRNSYYEHDERRYFPNSSKYKNSRKMKHSFCTELHAKHFKEENTTENVNPAGSISQTVEKKNLAISTE